MKAIAAVVIFALSYLLIATEKVNKTIVAVIGASLMLALKLVSFEHAVESVDLNVIFLLVGMMTAVSILSKTGFFEWTATGLAKRAGGSPVRIMLVLLIVTAVFSAVLDNVTTVVLLVPVTILIAQILEISPIPFVVMEVLASNVGGTATLIGDPPNIIIGSKANLSFNAFVFNLAPAVIVVMGFLLLVAFVIFRSRMTVPENIRKRVLEAVPHLAIVDRKNMIRALAIIGLMLLGFSLHSVIGLEPGVIALAGSMVLMLVCRAESDEAFMEVEWSVIFFFIGLFMMIAALEANGVIEILANSLLSVGKGNLLLLCIAVLWGSAVFSSILDNIPFVITMVPMLKYCIAPIAAAMGVTDPAVIQKTIAEPLWWSLALGACLGGNGTLIGASANVVTAHICERNKYPIGFMLFSKYGFLFMLCSIAISTVYLWLRYF